MHGMTCMPLISLLFDPQDAVVREGGALRGLQGSHLAMTPVTWPQWLRGQCLLPKLLGTDL